MVKKLLLVDDEEDMLKLLSYRLKHAGYEVITAGDGQIALDTLENVTPDLILLDLRMPNMDGYEFCELRKENENIKRIPVILLSASLNQDPRNITSSLEVEDVIIKPFEPQDLIDKIEGLIGKP